MKLWVEKNLPMNDPLREIILNEADELSPEEFLVISKRWLKMYGKAE